MVGAEGSMRRWLVLLRHGGARRRRSSCAAEVVSKLAGKRQNALRMSAILGAIESIMSLLYSNTLVSATHPQNQPGAVAEHEGASPAGRGYDHLPFGPLLSPLLTRPDPVSTPQRRAWGCRR